MSEGAANEARVVISTDYQTMKDFVEFTESKLDSLKNQGKGSFDAIGKAGTAMGGLIQGVFIGAGMELVNSFIGPLKHGFGEAIASAEKFRHSITSVAVSSGESIKKVGRDLEDLSRNTLRSVEDLNGFIERVRTQTGDRRAAKAAVAGASKEARARGYENVAEMADETIQLQQRWGVSDTEAFFNKQRSGAKALGVNENLAAETFKRMMPMLVNTGTTAEGASKFSAQMLKLSGGNMQQALGAGQQWSSFVQGNLPFAEMTLRSAGMLGKNETLRDEKNQPDIGRAWDLMEKFTHKKRGQKGMEWVALQKLPGALGAFFSRQTAEMREAGKAWEATPAGTPLADTEGTFRESEEGQNAQQDVRLAAEQRKAGKKLLEKQLWWKRFTKGGGLGYITGPIDYAGRRIGEAFDEWASPTGSNHTTEDASRAWGGVADQAGGFMSRSPAQGAGGYAGPGFGPWAPPLSAAATQDPKQLAAEQGKALATGLQAGQGLPVVIRGPVTIEYVPAGAPGKGPQ